MSSVGTLAGTGAPQGTHESNVLFNRAMEMLNRNRAAVARKDLEQALQICPQHPGYLSLYGLCVAVESDDYDAARKICEKAVRMNPGDPQARVNLGRVLRLEGDKRAAYEEFLTAYRMDNMHPAPASELSRMGIRRPPVLPFLRRSHWLNVHLGKIRAGFLRLSARL